MGETEESIPAQSPLEPEEVLPPPPLVPAVAEATGLVPGTGVSGLLLTAGLRLLDALEEVEGGGVGVRVVDGAFDWDTVLVRDLVDV